MQERPDDGKSSRGQASVCECVTNGSLVKNLTWQRLQEVAAAASEAQRLQEVAAAAAAEKTECQARQAEAERQRLDEVPRERDRVDKDFRDNEEAISQLEHDEACLGIAMARSSPFWSTWPSVPPAQRAVGPCGSAGPWRHRRGRELVRYPCNTVRRVGDARSVASRGHECQ